jgi:hypothetical protein
VHEFLAEPQRTDRAVYGITCIWGTVGIILI